MTYILVIWTVVGFAGAGTQYTKTWEKAYDWRPIGEFASLDYCNKAATDMVAKEYRCLVKGK